MNIYIKKIYEYMNEYMAWFVYDIGLTITITWKYKYMEYITWIYEYLRAYRQYS